MQHAKLAAKLFILAAFAAWVGWDVYGAVVYGTAPTERNPFTAWAARWPHVAAALGYLLGHWIGFNLHPQGKLPEEYYAILKRIEDRLYAEKDVCKRLDIILEKLHARLAFFREEVSRGTIEPDRIKIEQLEELVHRTEAAKLLLDGDCDKPTAA